MISCEEASKIASKKYEEMEGSENLIDFEGDHLLVKAEGYYVFTDIYGNVWISVDENTGEVFGNHFVIPKIDDWNAAIMIPENRFQKINGIWVSDAK